MGSAIRPRGPYFRGMPCVSGSKTAGAPHSVMRGLRYLYSFARDACPGGSLELRLRQSCAALIDLRDFNPLRESATRQQSCSTSFPSYNEFKGEYRFTPFVSSQQLVRQVHDTPLPSRAGLGVMTAAGGITSTSLKSMCRLAQQPRCKIIVALLRTIPSRGSMPVLSVGWTACRPALCPMPG